MKEPTSEPEIATTLPAPPARRLEAIVCGWNPPAASDGVPDADHRRRLIESACAAGIEVAIVTSARLDEADGRLGARPRGPGRLLLVPERGAAIFRVDQDGPQPVRRGPITADDETELSQKLGLADKSGSLRRVMIELWLSGIGPSQVLAVSDEFGAAGWAAVLENQIEHRLRGELPLVSEDPEWTLAVADGEAGGERARESLLALADGRLGTRGSRLVSHPDDDPRVLLSGVYTGAGLKTQLLAGPRWNSIGLVDDGVLSTRRVLDLRAGTLSQDSAGEASVRALQFSALTRPATTVLRVRGRGAVPEAPSGLELPPEGRHERGVSADSAWVRVIGSPGSIVAASHENMRAESPPGGRGDWRLDRLTCYEGTAAGVADEQAALATLHQARGLGFEALLLEHRAAWAVRWEDADIRIGGDRELQRAVRFALFHLMASVDDDGEAAVGARGLTGNAYRGHVFWDSDVYVLPFLAATHPNAARAMLEYRVRRLPAALRAAHSEGRRGARFPWESAASGDDVTPVSMRNGHGEIDPVYTGRLEEHITADVAWAAAHYIDWTGDTAFAAGPGLELLVQTARWWAARIEVDADGSAHIRGVMGPDEYHERVDDNAYTNVMARWNLRRAAHADLGGALAPAERHGWLDLADALVDGYDPETGIYEQFAGYNGLEPLLIAELASQRPIAADMLLGHERTRLSQVVKQPDVLMLHYLVPEEVAPGSLARNLEYYEPRTAHGSTLSPGVHAALLARGGRIEQAADLLRLTARIDLDDIGGLTAGGLHVAAMGSVWRALAFGFAGLRPVGDALAIAPVVASSWETLVLRVRFRGSRVRVNVHPDAVTASADIPVAALNPAGERVLLGPVTQTFDLPTPAQDGAR